MLGCTCAEGYMHFSLHSLSNYNVVIKDGYMKRFTIEMNQTLNAYKWELTWFQVGVSFSLQWDWNGKLE